MASHIARVNRVRVRVGFRVRVIRLGLGFGLGLASEASRVYLREMSIHTATGEVSRV